MDKKLILWVGVLALTAAPALSLRAQEGPEGGETKEVEVWDGSPEVMPRTGMDHKGSREMKEEKGVGQGRGQMTGKVRKMMGGGPGFLSEDETLAVIKKHDAAFAKKVEDLKTIAPPKYRMVMQMSGKLLAVSKMEGDEATEKDAVRMLALEFESKELSLKFDKASDADKKGIKDALKANLSELFDLKSKGQELRVKRMEADLAKLKKNLEKRKVNKDKIVEQRLEQLTGEGYGW